MTTTLRTRCPRCRGNLFLLKDNGVPEQACLQCGRRYTLELQLVAHRPEPRAA